VMNAREIRPRAMAFCAAHENATRIEIMREAAGE
jgi:hypothetical protein